MERESKMLLLKRSLRSFRHRLKICFEWHREAKAWNSSVVDLPIFLGLIAFLIVGGVCIANKLWLLAILLAPLAALLGIALGGYRYWFVLAQDRWCERELQRRLVVMQEVVEKTGAIFARHSAYDQHAFQTVRALSERLARMDSLWYEKGIGAWVKEAVELTGEELRRLVFHLNWIHKNRDANFQELERPRNAHGHEHCDHRQIDGRWGFNCTYCYEELWRKLSAPLLQEEGSCCVE